MTQSDERLAFIRRLLGGAPRPDAPNPPDIDPDPDPDPDPSDTVRAIFRPKENQS